MNREESWPCILSILVRPGSVGFLTPQTSPRRGTGGAIASDADAHGRRPSEREGKIIFDHARR